MEKKCFSKIPLNIDIVVSFTMQIGGLILSTLCRQQFPREKSMFFESDAHQKPDTVLARSLLNLTKGWAGQSQW